MTNGFDVDLLVVGADEAAHSLAELAANRFMRVVTLAGAPEQLDITGGGVTVQSADGTMVSARWLASTDPAIGGCLGIDSADVGSASLAVQFRVGPVFLVGSGGGSSNATAGLDDATHLAWRLQAVHQGHAHSRLLDAYDIERRTHAAARLSGASAPRIGQLAGTDPLVGTTLGSLDAIKHRIGFGWVIVVAEVAWLPERLLARWIGIGTRVVLGADAMTVAELPVDGALIVRPDRTIAAVAYGHDEFGALSEQLFGWYADGEPVAANVTG